MNILDRKVASNNLCDMAIDTRAEINNHNKERLINFFLPMDMITVGLPQKFVNKGNIEFKVDGLEDINFNGIYYFSSANRFWLIRNNEKIDILKATYSSPL